MKSEKSQKKRLSLKTQKTGPKSFLKKNAGLQPKKKSITRLPNNLSEEFVG
jgi:hypothetical protein